MTYHGGRGGWTLGFGDPNGGGGGASGSPGYPFLGTPGGVSGGGVAGDGGGFGASGGVVATPKDGQDADAAPNFGGGGGGAADGGTRGGMGAYGRAVITLADEWCACCDSFGRVAVSGQDDVVAEVCGDTLTLAAGAGIAITTNATTDTVTIAVASGITGTCTVKVSGVDKTLTFTNGIITGLA